MPKPSPASSTTCECFRYREQLSCPLSSENDLASRNPGEAYERARRVFEVKPGASKEAYPLATLGMAQYQTGHYEDAIESFRSAIEAEERGQRAFAPLSLFTAMSHWQAGQAEAARQWYERAMVERRQSDWAFAECFVEAEDMIGSSGLDPP